jgi:hypothetical protein
MSRVSRWISAVAVLALVACSGDSAGKLPPPSDGTSTTSTSIVDYSGVRLRGVTGKTTTTIDNVGRSDVQGFVTGPGGVVGGATVRIERLVFDAVVTSDVVSRPEDGGFDLPQVPGGRYRVRAFLPPTLAQVKPEVFFLQDGEQKKLDLKLAERTGFEVRSATAPQTPLEGDPVNLVVQVVSTTVDADGVVRSVPVPNEQVQLGGSSRWRLRSSNPVFTDGQGKARFELTCQSAGPPQLIVQLASTGEIVPLDLPDCVDPATLTTTTTQGSSTSGGAQSTTSTTRK